METRASRQRYALSDGQEHKSVQQCNYQTPTFLPERFAPSIGESVARKEIAYKAKRYFNPTLIGKIAAVFADYSWIKIGGQTVPLFICPVG